MKALKRMAAALAVFALSARAVFADVAPMPEPEPNDYIPMVSYIVVGLIALIIIIAVIILIAKLRKRRRDG